MKKIAFIFSGIVFSLMIQGCGKEPSIDQIKTKIVKVETPHGKYTTVNKKSGAYGRYQIMPKTARYYSKKLNINYSQWKLPKNQDKIFHALLEDNIRDLKKRNLKIDAFSVYGCHQQGATGFMCIINNENMTAKSYMRLRRNLPKKYRHPDKEQLRKNWIKYWQYKIAQS